jgi:formylglycine-generating enzyme required for sulfatase activity/uncharacterized membrane protein
MGSSKEEIDFWLKQQNVIDWVKERLPGEGPQHEVEITQPFYMGQTEVTVGQFRQFVKATGYQTQAEREGGAFRCFPNGEWKMDANTSWLNLSFAQTDDHPVMCLTWNDAVEFCDWLSKQEGKSYRLPTEAEWEYSCRAGSKGRWSFGDNEGQLFNYARFTRNSQGHAWPVAGLEENAWGLHDMHGNVAEWCQDVYDANYYKTSPPKDPLGPADGGERVIRGGSFTTEPVDCRAAWRHHSVPGDRNFTFGFRVVLVVAPHASVRTESGAKDKPSPPAIAPFTDADVQRIAALPATEQVEEVRKELMRRNPGFDGKVEHKIEDGVVTEFRIVTDQVTDIAPIRVFNALRVLDCSGTPTPDWQTKSRLADLSPLKGMNLTGLTHLSLRWTKIDDTGMACFKDSKNLIDLLLTGTHVGDTGLAHFKDCRNLTQLWLDGTNVSDAGLAHIKDCKKLTILYLQVTKVGDAGLANVKGLPLKALWIDDTGISDLTLLQGMPLENIRLTPKNITKGLDILRDMKSLKIIGIEGGQSWPAAEFWERYDRGEFSSRPQSPVDRRAAAYVLSLGGTVKVNEQEQEIKAAADLPPESFRLTSVSLRDNKQVSDAGLAVFNDCKNLTSIDLYRTPVTDAGLAHFKDCKNLTSLDLHDTRVSDAGLIHLKDCKALMELHLTRTNVSDVGLAHFKDCKNLTSLYVDGTQVGDAGLVHFKDCKDLTSLNLNDTRVSDAGLGYFRDCKALTHVDLARTKVSDVGLAHFKDCKNLTEMHLDGTHVGDAGLAHFKDCKNLTSLKLNGTRVSDAGLIHFKDCKALTELNLAGTRVSVVGLTHFKDCKNLENLHLDGTQVGDAGLAQLKGMPLTVLWIDNTGITDLIPLQGMPLEDIRLTPKNITRGLDILRDMKSLKTIGIDWNQSWPAAEFWERYDKGEFK